MSRFRSFMAFAVLLATLPAPAAQRTFVSTNGNDADPCNLPAPCRSFAAALLLTDDRGEIIALDSGGYGRVTIDRSVTIQAPAGVYAGIAVFPSFNGIDISTAGVDVALRGLSINGQGGGPGINFAAGNSLRVERCAISNISTDFGIVATAPDATVMLDDVLLTDSGTGISATGLATFAAERLRIERSSAEAVLLSNVRTVTIRASRVVKAGSRGIVVQSNVAAGIVDALVEDVLVSEASVIGVHGIAAGSASNVTLAVTRSSVLRSGSGGNGAVRASSGAGVIDLTLANSLVESAGGLGVDTKNPGATLTLANSAVVRSVGLGLYADPGTVFYTRGNNTVRGNNGADLVGQTGGTITFLPGL